MNDVAFASTAVAAWCCLLGGLSCFRFYKMGYQDATMDGRTAACKAGVARYDYDMQTGELRFVYGVREKLR